MAGVLRTRGKRSSKGKDTPVPKNRATVSTWKIALRRLLDAGLSDAASKRQPSRGGIGAIIRPRIERNRRIWGSVMNRVHDHFE